MFLKACNITDNKKSEDVNMQTGEVRKIFVLLNIIRDIM